MKQTAVDWLVEQYEKAFTLKVNTVMTSVIEQAKAMEKEQIVNSFKEGLRSPYHQDYAIVTQEGQEATKSGQYYNETYNK